MDGSQVGALERRAKEISVILRGLGNDARLLVLCQLVRSGEMQAGALTGVGGLGQSALSQHLKRMREDGLVASRRDGQTIWYRIADPRIEDLIAQLHRLYCAEES